MFTICSPRTLDLWLFDCWWRALMSPRTSLLPRSWLISDVMSSWTMGSGDVVLAGDEVKKESVEADEAGSGLVWVSIVHILRGTLKCWSIRIVWSRHRLHLLQSHPCFIVRNPFSSIHCADLFFQFSRGAIAWESGINTLTIVALLNQRCILVSRIILSWAPTAVGVGRPTNFSVVP